MTAVEDLLSEAQLQRQCITWFRYNFPKRKKLLHMNFNNPRNKIQGKRLKDQGMIAGVADLEYNVKGKTYFLEAKTTKGRQSTKQKEFQEAIEADGFDYFIFRTFSEFVEIIESIHRKLGI